MIRIFRRKQEWEYLVDYYYPANFQLAFENHLKEKGMNGWELVSVTFKDSVNAVLVFKRKKI